MCCNTEQLLAVILARKADYAGALLHLNNCLSYMPAGPQADLVKQQIAQLEPKVTPSNNEVPRDHANSARRLGHFQHLVAETFGRV